MSKSVLISIRPKWAEKVANGEKTIEVRKTCPKLAAVLRAMETVRLVGANAAEELAGQEDLLKGTEGSEEDAEA